MPASGSHREDRLPLSQGLSSSGLCAGLSIEAVLTLSGHCRSKTYRALQEAVTEGRRCEEIEIVTSGRFLVLLPSKQIDLHASGSFGLHLYLPGDCFGLSGLIGATPAAASVIASEASTTISIAAADLRRALDDDHSSAAIVYRNLFAIQSRRLDSLGSR